MGTVVQVILYTFPAVCWLYGAGFIFSAFVSAIFWGVPLQSLWSLVASNSTAHPRHLKVHTHVPDHTRLCTPSVLSPVGIAPRQEEH